VVEFNELENRGVVARYLDSWSLPRPSHLTDLFTRTCGQLEYYEEWRKVHAAAFSKAPSHDSEIKRKSNSGKTVWSDPCTDWPLLWQEIATQLGAGVHTLASINSILKTPKRVDSPFGSRSPKGCCIDAIDQWRTSIEGDLGKIPSFAKFFN
jgi:hypothetical protein